MGRSLVAAAAASGIAGLCYYGAGLAAQPGAIDTAQFWPAFVRERVRLTFSAFAAGLAMTAGQSYLLFRSGFAYRMMAASPWVTLIGSVAACFGSQMLLHSIDYETNKLAKFGAFAVFTGCTAAIISPIMLMGGAIVMRAAAYTAVVCGGLSAVAACAPSDQFLYMGAPLAAGLGLVICASVGGMIFPAYAAAAHGIYTYGGLVLFGGFMMYDMQKILHLAQIRELHYDPINQSVGIYMDTINIFIRIAMILSGSGGNRRR
jgi:FtsH-binding integral membrane protein